MKRIFFILFALAFIALTITCKKDAQPEEPDMILVEGGTFTMGCTDGDCSLDGREEPAHQVTVSSFKIGKYPITQKQWNSVMGTNSSYFKGDNLPVETVSWEDAQEFITKLNAATGKKYRLLTEAEWEFACRGGLQSGNYQYSGSNDLNAVAWHDGNSEGKTHPVGTKQPNELGIYDMNGNVWEWCNDWYGAYSADTQTNPQGATTGLRRVGRGGSWGDDAQHCRVSMRSNGAPNARDEYSGFRLALSI